MVYMNDNVLGAVIDQIKEMKKNQKDLTEKIDQFYRVEEAQDNINDWTVRCISNLCKGWIATTVAIIILTIIVLFFK